MDERTDPVYASMMKKTAGGMGSIIRPHSAGSHKASKIFRDLGRDRALSVLADKATSSAAAAAADSEYAGTNEELSWRTLVQESPKEK